MIQWCEDCKHFLWAMEDSPSREDMDYCRECLDESKPGEQAIRWEKREELGIDITKLIKQKKRMAKDEPEVLHNMSLR